MRCELMKDCSLFNLQRDVNVFIRDKKIISVNISNAMMMAGSLYKYEYVACVLYEEDVHETN